MARINLETQLLRSFIAIQDTGGFARAADMLNMTQPAISQQMRRLEDLLGTPLFLRQGRTMRLTQQGETLLGSARRMVELNDQIAEQMCGQKPREIVHLGVPEHFSEGLLPHIIAATARELPDIQLVVRIGTSQTLMAGLDQGEIDLAMLLAEAGTNVQPVLRTIPVAWMAGDGCRLQPGQDVPLVLFTGQCTFRRMILQSLDAAGLRWHCAYEASDLFSLRAAVRANLGITGLPVPARSDLSVAPSLAWLPPLPMSEMSLRSRPSWSSRAAERLGDLIPQVIRCVTEDSTNQALTKNYPQPAPSGG